MLIGVAIVPRHPDARLRRADLAGQPAGSRAGRRSSAASCWPTCSSSRLIGAWAYLGLDWVAGHPLVPAQDVRVRVHLRLDARHAAPRPDRPADGLRLEVAAAGVAAQPVRDRGGDRRLRDGEDADEPRPGPRHREGHGPDAAPVLRAEGHGQVPRGAGPTSPPKFRGRLQLLYDEWGTLKCETCFQCAQACPIECIDMGGIDTKRPLPRPLGRARDVRRAARGIGAAAVRPARARIRRSARSRRSTRRPSTASSRRYDYDPADMLASSRRRQAAYGYLPVAALKRISQKTGAWYAMLYGTASYYSHLRFEPPRRPSQAAAVGRHRPSETTLSRRARRSAGGQAAERRGTELARWPTLLKTPGRLADDPPRAGARRRPDRPRRGGPRRRVRWPPPGDPRPRRDRDDRDDRGSGLRGRGGGGFPAGDKWRIAASTPAARATWSSTATARTRRPPRTGPARARPVRGHRGSHDRRLRRSVRREAFIAVRAEATEAIRTLEAAIGAA